MDVPNSFSTPIKSELEKGYVNHSVDDLLQAINNNLSTSSVNLLDEEDNVDTLYINISDDNPITPLKVKHSAVQHDHTVEHVYSKSLPGSPFEEGLIQNIPRAPSFDELEFNTRLNRESSLSRVSGPRQLSNSTLSRTLSNKMGRSTSFKSAGYSSRDNSPSKRSVCFDESPPKIVEYDELTPHNSDESYEDEEVLDSQWDGKLKSHLLPPPPPKHQVMASPPIKDTTLISSDDDSQEFNLTKEDLVNNSITLEQKLDLVLGSDEISRKVQEDEINRGSGSPLRSMDKNEEEFILSIKTKSELAEEQSLRDASELFEVDLMNNDKESNVLRLDPALKRRSSNSSLRDEEKLLITEVVSKSTAPITLQDGLKNADLDNLPQSDDLISVGESTHDSFASVTDVFESEPINIGQKSIPSHESYNSVTTLDFEKTHKKKLSLSESINSFISSFTKSPRKSLVKEEVEDIEIPGDFPVDLGSTDGQEENDVEDKQMAQDRLDSPMQPAEDKVVDEVSPEARFSEELSHSIGTHNPEEVSVGLEAGAVSPKDIESSAPIDSSEVVGQTEEQFLLEDALPAVENAEHEVLIDNFILEKPPLLGELEETSFSDEFKETMLYNTSDSMDASYRSTPLALVRQVDILDDLDDDGLNRSPVDDKSLLHLKHESISEAGVEDEKAYVSHEQDAALEQDSQQATVTEAANKCELIKHVFPDAETNQKQPPTLVPPLDEFLPVEEISGCVLKPTGYVEQSQLVHVKEVAVQTEDMEEYRSLKPSSAQLEIKTQSALPSFDSTLFHDKPPNDDDVVSPPTSYIEIWHNQPKSISPDPQYSLNGRKLSPPTNVLRVLSTRRNKHEYIIDTTEVEIEIKEENFPRTSLEVARSFIATSASRSSFINVDSKGSSVLDSSFNADTSGITLPDVSQSSDFGKAFQDWIVSSEPETKLEKSRDSSDKIRSIWGSHDANLPYEAKNTVSFGAAGQIERLIAGSELSNVHFKSSNAVGEVVVTENADLGLVIEFDRDSEYDISDYRIKHGPPSPKLVGTLPKKTELAGIKPPHVIKSSAVIEIPSVVSNSKQRFISGDSECSGFDLKDDFDKAIQLQSHSYVAHEHQDIILATSDTNDGNMVEEDDLSTPEPMALKYGKTRSRPTTASQSPANARVRTPLASVSDSSLNQPPQKKSSVAADTVLSSKLSKIEDGRHKVKKHRSSESITHAESDVKLPANDKGRLYLHINSLKDVMLKQIKSHKATFKLYLDNGKHTISTPKMELNSEVDMDKEFEIAVDELSTELFFTLKVSYQRPETELVDVYEKVLLSNSRLSRLIGLKPKYRVEKRYQTRKKTHDEWDNIFATDGSFGKNKITFYSDDNEITARTQNYNVELFNEWETQVQDGKEYKKAPYLVGKLDVTMLYLPRSSPLENLPPSIRIAETVANHISEQSNIRFEGFLFQYGGDCELWKRRFFYVEGTNMVAHTEDTKKPRAQINLLKVVDVLHNGKKKVRNQRNVTDDILMSDGFKLKFKNGEIINFNAETKELKCQWIEVLERIVELNKFHQPWVKKLVANKE